MKLKVIFQAILQLAILTLTQTAVNPCQNPQDPSTCNIVSTSVQQDSIVIDLSINIDGNTFTINCKDAILNSTNSIKIYNQVSQNLKVLINLNNCQFLAPLIIIDIPNYNLGPQSVLIMNNSQLNTDNQIEEGYGN
jgi:hypothetical protein